MLVFKLVLVVSAILVFNLLNFSFWIITSIKLTVFVIMVWRSCKKKHFRSLHAGCMAKCTHTLEERPWLSIKRLTKFWLIEEQVLTSLGLSSTSMTYSPPISKLMVQIIWTTYNNHTYCDFNNNNDCNFSRQLQRVMTQCYASSNYLQVLSSVPLQEAQHTLFPLEVSVSHLFWTSTSIRGPPMHKRITVRSMCSVVLCSTCDIIS